MTQFSNKSTYQLINLSTNQLINYTLHLADNPLILAQRNSAWCGHGPILEQDIAITNISLDLLGQARNFYQYAAEVINQSTNQPINLSTLKCPECGGKLEPRGGFFGPFLACENHPKKCKYTRPIKGEKVKPVMTDIPCHICGAPMVIRLGRSGQFLGCSTFPKCRGTKSMPTGVFCPKDNGELVERRSRKRGTAFYACSNETCDFVAWNKPVNEKCPDCSFVGAEMKFTKTRGDFRKCLKCGNEWDAPKTEDPAEATETAPALAG